MRAVANRVLTASISRGFRAPVRQQGVAVLNFGRGLQVREKVGPPEPVNGLLGVADEEQGPALGKDAFEDGVLHGVGVLELVDEGRLVAAADGGGQDFARGCLPARG